VAKQGQGRPSPSRELRGDDSTGVDVQSLYRVVNEQIEQLGARWTQPYDTMIVVCECADPDCLERFELATSLYDAVRAEPTRFVLAPGHKIADADRVVEAGPDYLIVEKTGEDAVRAARLDPRAAAVRSVS
jgi:hypothetical protein